MKQLQFCLILFMMLLILGCMAIPTPVRTGIAVTEEPTEMADYGSGEGTSQEFSGQKEDIEFAIFLVQQEETEAEMAKVELNELPLEDSPILSIHDIIEYIWEAHEITLTPSAYARLTRLQAKVPYPGLSFVVCVGSERIYRGAVWTSYSSVPFDGIVIDIYPAESGQPIRIETGYPTSEWFIGEDLRSDTRIFESLAFAQKLQSRDPDR